MLENVPDNSLNFPLRLTSQMTGFAGFFWRGWNRGRGGPGFAATAAVCLVLLSGCSRLRPKPTAQYVYVTAKQTFLRDRVAAVSNRTGTVENGQKLEVLEHGRRFYRVKTDKGEQGWIEEKAVATQEVFDAFLALAQAHKANPAVASAVVRDEVNLHLKPGRETERFYRLAEGDKLQLLERATLPAPVRPGAVAPAKSGAAAPAKSAGSKMAGPPGAEGTVAPVPIAMEDWWLGRDVHGRTGWLLSRMLDVDAPDSVAKYAEGQRIVGAYVLTTVFDPGAEQDDKNIPIYLTVLGPYTAGLAYDFDQVRVFTWSMKMHRYETAFREKNMEGYLPVAIAIEKDPYGKSAVAQTPEPTFTYKVLAADAGPVVPDPVTGAVKPGRTIAKTYRLESNLVRRVAAPGSKDDPEAHPVAEEKKDKGAKKKR
jgi:SH3-like domain-containing protein